MRYILLRVYTRVQITALFMKYKKYTNTCTKYIYRDNEKSEVKIKKIIRVKVKEMLGCRVNIEQTGSRH